jgi:hypothetical protein
LNRRRIFNGRPRMLEHLLTHGQRRRILLALCLLSSLIVAVPVGAGQSPWRNPPSNTALPVISGSATQGRTLTVSNGSWSGSTPMSFAYQWRRCDSAGATCAAISGATSQSYLLRSADVGFTLRAAVTATNRAGSATAVSAATAVVVVLPPVNTALPVISGSATQGQTLTVSNGSWSGSTPMSFTYQWRRCDSQGLTCAPISGATSQSYPLSSADVSFTLRAAVTATNGAGSAAAVSAATAVVAVLPPVSTALPSISGTATVGNTLNASTFSWSGSTPMSFAYDWQRCDSAGANCVNITGATSQSYVLASADQASTLRVVVTASNLAGSSSATSAATAVVQAASPSGWITVLDDRFDVGLVPAHYTLYNGLDGWTGNGCFAPSHVFVSGGYLHLLMSYESTTPAGAANCPYSAGWYTGGLSIASAYQGAPYNMANNDQRVTVRFRILSTGGVVSHRIIPMRWPAVPQTTQNDGEEDFCENDGSLTGCKTFMHYGSNNAYVWSQYIIDLSQWHTIQATQLNHTVSVSIDGVPMWSYTGDATTVPDVTRRLVLQQECQHYTIPNCPTNTAGTEDIQVDWITVENPA